MRRFLSSLFGRHSQPIRHSKPRRLACPEQLERREVFAADPLPVLMVIADQRDFYYQEYNDTRISLEAAGLEVDVAATTISPSTPHPNTGQGSASGIVNPELRLSDVQASDYSAIVFVGGWGSSMYQYAFPGTYYNSAYNGDLATKEVVNNLIDDFADQGKHVAAICHGVTVLAWARVDGVSPINGHQVAVPWLGSPACEYNGQTYWAGQLLQNVQAIANGATTQAYSGAIGDPTTAADDVIVDGRIITAENYDSAAMFGRIVAQEVLAALPPENTPPIVTAATFTIAENSPIGSAVGSVIATDNEEAAGQQLSFAITGGNTGGAFAINPLTGQISAAALAPLDFETNPVFQLVVTATDNGSPAMSGSAVITVRLTDVAETPPAVEIVGGNLIIRGTPLADRIFVLPANGDGDVDGRDFLVWQRNVGSGPYSLGPNGHIKIFAGSGNDTVSIDSRLKVATEIHGQAGDDLLLGGSGRDVLLGGDGNDRLEGNAGGDRLEGGAGNDYLKGWDGDDRIFGGSGNDTICGGNGNDLVLGESGDDWLWGGDGLDIVIGGLGRDTLTTDKDDLATEGTTRADQDEALLAAVLQDWSITRDRERWIDLLSY